MLIPDWRLSQMKRIIAIIVMILMLVPAWPLGAGEPSFEGGADEATAVLAAPAYEATVNLVVPADYYTRNLTMRVTGLASEGNASAYPESVTVGLNNTILWGFQRTGFGPMGMQDRFYSGQKEVQLSFGKGGGSQKTHLRLPKEAVVQSAFLELKGSPVISKRELINYTGTDAGDGLGYAVSMAGDVNGDGFGDVVVVIPFDATKGTNAGRAHIYFGGASLNASPGVVLLGENPNRQFGFSVSDAGDVNGDGYDDVIVGAWYNAFIFFGGPHMDPIADVVLSNSSLNDTILYVGCAGDVNNDGYDDVILGGSYYLNPGQISQAAYIYFGGPNMDNKLDVALYGRAGSFSCAMSVSSAGDLNNDSYDDVIFGDNFKDIIGDNTGEVYIFFGGQNMDNKTNVNLTGTSNLANLGFCVSGGGDINEDGYDDVLVACVQHNGNMPGAVYVLFGGQNMDNKIDMTFSNIDIGNDGHQSVDRAGDVNGDGHGDIIVGAYSESAASNGAGAVYVYYGGKNMDTNADLTFLGDSSVETCFGISASGAGDVNNDGYDDMIVGSPFNSANGDGAGRAYIYSLVNVTFGGLLDPSLVIDSKTVWNRSGTLSFDDTESTVDLAAPLNAHLRSAQPSGKDEFGNAYVDIPLVTFAGSEGILTLFNLSIRYDHNATIMDFSPHFNSYLQRHKSEKDASGNINLPLRIKSQTAGRVKIFGLEIGRDFPPAQVKKIDGAELDEDSTNVTLIDLHAYFQDDIDQDDNLTFTIVSSTNSTIVRLWITAKRYLSADAMTWEENDNWTGTVEARVASSDRWGQATESNTFTIVIKDVNDAPVITSSPPPTAEAGVRYQYNVSADDGDDDPLEFTLSKAPEGMTIDSHSGEIRWMPRARGVHDVTVAVSDGLASAEQVFRILVLNKAPRITSEPPLNAVTGVPYFYNVTAEDDNLDPLEFSLTTSIIGMSIEPSNGTILWTPLLANEYNVVVKVSDGREGASQEFVIKVAQGNRVPKFVSSPVKTATAGLPYEYQAMAADDDGDTLSFSLNDPPRGMAVDKVSGKISWTPASAGNFTVRLKASDGRGGEAAQEFVIQVLERVRAKVQFTAPSDGQKVKGKLAVTGSAIKGTLDIVKVQLRVDSGDWTDAAGNSTWTYTLDTTKLKNGKHTLQARAYDEMDYSDIVNRTITVDNQKEAAKGFIPGFVGTIGLAAAAFGLVMRRRRMTSRCR
jgi:hypothetical protein